MVDPQQTAGDDQPLIQPTELSPQTQPSSHPGEPTALGTPQSGSAVETALTVGSTLGPYLLLAKLGEGGMGAVYKARHTRLDKVVAIKVLSGHLTKQAAAVSRFGREMQAVGKIDHPNIVRAMDAGEVGGTHYLAMEYVEGDDLQQLVQARGPLSVVHACKAIRQAALALAAAHGAGLVLVLAATPTSWFGLARLYQSRGPAACERDLPPAAALRNRCAPGRVSRYVSGTPIRRLATGRYPALPAGGS